MARYMLFAFFLLVFIHLKPCVGSLRAPAANTGFIRTCCGATIYPSLCFSSLSAYASKIRTSRTQLTRTALSLALNATGSAHAAIKAMSRSGGPAMSPRVAAAMRDCAETIGDAADQLKQSVDAIGGLGGKDDRFLLNSIQTWVSAVITNDYTCTDGFNGRDMDGVVKAAVTRQVIYAERLTSNALAFVNLLAADHSHS